MVVVDVDDDGGAVDGCRVLADAALVRAVDGEEDALRRGRPARRGVRPVEREKPVLRRQRGAAGEVHHHVLAERAQPERDREHRAERVAVGVLVRDDEEAVVSADRLARPRRAQSTLAVIVAHLSRRQVGRKVVDQLRHVHALLDRRIEDEGQCRRPAEAQLAPDAGLQHAVRRFEPGQRRAPLLLVAEHREVDRRLGEVRGHPDAGDGDHADPRVLERADALRDDGADRLVHPAHALGHDGRSLVLG